MFAQLVQGKFDLADVLFLLAAILFGLTAVYLIFKNAVLDGHVWQIVIAIGVCLISLGFFVS